MKSSATTPPTHLLTLRPLQVSVRPTPHAQQNRAGDHRQRHAERHDGSSSSEAPHLILYSSTPRAGRCSGHQCQHGASLETQKWVTPAQLVRVRRALPHAVCSGVCKARLVMLKCRPAVMSRQMFLSRKVLKFGSIGLPVDRNVIFTQPHLASTLI